MKILNENEVTLKELREMSPPEPTIIIHDAAPVMVVLPIGDCKHLIWTEQFLILIKHLVEHLGHDSNLIPGGAREQPRRTDPGMVEVSIALAGVAMAIAAFLPEIGSIPEILRRIVASISSIVAFFSAGSALWLLARYSLPEESLSEEKRMWTLLTSPKYGPYWFMALGLLFLALLSFPICYLALTG